MARTDLPISFPTYLISVIVKAFSRKDHYGVIEGKVVLYLTFHFQIRTRTLFIFSWYPPTVILAVYQYPDIVGTIHLLAVSLKSGKVK